MIGKSWFDYVRIRVSIAALRSIAPACIVYLALCAVRRQFLVSPWLAPYALAEASFLLLVYTPRYFRLQKAASHPPLIDRDARSQLFERCLKHLASTELLAAWFLSSDVKRNNVKEWVLWAIFASDEENMQEEWVEEMDGYLNMIEDKRGVSLQPGHSIDTKSMRPTLDPVPMIHRPLVWYLIVGGVDMCSYLLLSLSGFRHYTPSRWPRSFPPRPLTIFSKLSTDRSLPYWYRPHRSSTELPVLFLHGIGIGLWPYTSFLKDLAARNPNVGILVIEFLPTSSRITDPPLRGQEICDAISRILDSLNLPRVVLVAHSYGTGVGSYLLRSPHLAPRIAATTLIDPIPFLLHIPHVAFNFIYRVPREANEWQLWYFASRDPDIARTLSRHFFWADIVMWKEELEGKNVAISLGGEDQIVPTRHVWKYLTGREEPDHRWSRDGLEVLYHPGLDHATVFDAKDRYGPLLDIIVRFVSYA